MAAELFFDINDYDVENPMADVERIEAMNPQRGDMRHLDAVVWWNEGVSAGIGYKDVKEDEFWVPGHIPGRPLLPGVVMIEAAAQLSSFMTKLRYPEMGFIGFIGCDEVKFRGQVTPGSRFYLYGKEVKFTARRFVSAIQGIVDNTLVFEAQIKGMTF